MSSTEPGLIKKVVLTGGPGVGKSSIAQCLAKLGYSVREEVFTSLFDKAQKEGRFNDQFLHSRELIHDLMQSQLELEKPSKDENLLFLDRSLIDIWGFARSMGITPFLDDKTVLESGKYDLIFMIEPMPKEFYEQNAIRRQSYSESLEHHQINVEASEGYLQMQRLDPSVHLVRVPFVYQGRQLSVSERTQFILDQVQKLIFKA